MTRRHRATIEPLEERTLLNRVHGIDVSVFQGTMNWNLAWNQNVRFTFIRSSSSLIGADANVHTNVPGAKARGILTGVYHHASPIFNASSGENTFIDPIQDAESFVAIAGQYMGPGYLRPVVDMEEDGSLNQNGYTINTWAAAFINRVQQLTGVAPMIYTTGFQAEFFLNQIAVTASPDVWMAVHFAESDPITTNSQPKFNGQVGPKPWREAAAPNPPETSWDFWQYSGSVNNGLGPSYGAQSSSIDLNVYNGDDINALKEQFVNASAKRATLLSPADGATGLAYVNQLLDWSDAVGAVAYDVYLDDMNTPAATNLTQSQWATPMIAGGSHTWRVVAKGVIGDAATHVTTTTRTFTTVPPPLPGAPDAVFPNDVIVNTHPVVLDWSDASDAVSYDVYLGTSPTPTFSNLTVSQAPPLGPLDGTRLWRVVAKNPSGSTNSTQFSYTMDKTAPTAAPGGNGVADFGTPTFLANTFTFNVTYTDATTAIDVNTLGGDDVSVTGPNGFSASALLMSVSNPANGSPRVATYRISAPDFPSGTWSRFDNGTYTVSQTADAVRDTAGNARPAGAIGTYTLNAPFAWRNGSELHVEPGPQGTPIGLTFDGTTTVEATEGATTLSFGQIFSVSFHGTAGDDTVEWNGTLSPSTFMTFDGGGGGNDLFHVQSGSMPLNTNYSATSPNLAVTIDAGASATNGSSQRLRALNVNGTMTFLTSIRDYAVLTRSLTVGANGRLDVKDHDLIVDPAAGDPPASAAAIQAMIAAASNGGAWDGFGVTTSMPDAQAGLTGIGVAPADAVLDFGASGTASFSGHTVTPDAVLLKYTYVGDANLDGQITGDDYSAIDFNILVSGASGYWNGDFNLDGIISGDDYSAIDFNLLAQGAPL